MNKKTEGFDYQSIPLGYYDLIYRKNKGIQSKWHHLKFQKIREEMGEYQTHLDIGCGPGTLIGTLCSNAGSIGVDVSHRQIEYAQTQYGSENRRFQLVRPRAPLPFENNNFDVVTITELIEHLTHEDAAFIIHEAHRVLCPEGKIIISTPNYKSCWPLMEVLVNKLSKVSYEDQHITHYNNKSLEKLLTQVGFTKINVSAFQLFSPFVAAINWKLADLVYRLEPNFIVSNVGLLLLAKGYKLS